MGFGNDFQGRSSHDALLQIQDAEIRLLENMKTCLQKRIDGDKKYVTALTGFVQAAQKLDQTEYHEYCSVFKAWDSIVKGTEKLYELLQNSVDGLSTKVMEKLSSLINSKKSARKDYDEERNRLERDFTKIKDDVQKNKQDYIKCVDKVRVDRAKYEDISAKGKGGNKVDDARARYQKTSMQLHQAHNKYYLSLCEVKSHQENYGSKTLPHFLDHHQATQEILVQQCKDFLEEFQQLTSYGTPEHVAITKSIQTSVKDISPESEYTGDFMEKYRSDRFEPVTFEFDGKILDDYQGRLVASELAVDTFTAEHVTHLKTSLDGEIEEMKKQMTDMDQEKKDNSRRLRDLKRQLATISEEDYNEYLEKRKAVEDLTKKVAETQSVVATKTDIMKAISDPLDRLGDQTPPQGLDLPESPGDNVSRNSIGDSSSGPASKLGSLFHKGRNPIGKFFKSKSKNAPTENGGKDEAGQASNYEESDNCQPGNSLSNNDSRYDGSDAVNKKLQDQDWFHGVLPREEVQRLLVEDGDFIVRESKNKKTNETQFVLSVYWQGYRHFIIQFQDGGWRFEGPCFPTIPELVLHHYKSRQPVTNKSQAVLSKPIIRESWELHNDDVQLETKIGNGNFGEVFRGIYTPTSETVAVKTCKDTLSEEQRKKFLMEGRILKQYDHPNIVRFIGIAAQRQPVMILMEYVAGGALLGFLRREGKRQTRLKATQMCVDAANGMAYLSDKGCIHRDLAARNCLVGDSNVVKISDFGMSREEEEYTVSDGMKQIPIKWTAPEALNFGKYTTQCDVWSYGILMWEIFSNGQNPYPGWSNTQARESIEQGYMMPAPTGTPSSVYELMKKCWDRDPTTRITFQQLYKGLKTLVDKQPKNENWQ